jgi:hypothetical protein
VRNRDITAIQHDAAAKLRAGACNTAGRADRIPYRPGRRLAPGLRHRRGPDARATGGWSCCSLAAILHRTLPHLPRATDLSYRSLLRSVGDLVADEPLLRRRVGYGALGMASFSVLWTAIAFLLAGAPYHYSEGTIGLFGLAGLVGAGAAQGAGRLADRGHSHAATAAFLLTIPRAARVVARPERRAS